MDVSCSTLAGYLIKEIVINVIQSYHLGLPLKKRNYLKILLSSNQDYCTQMADCLHSKLTSKVSIIYLSFCRLPCGVGRRHVFFNNSLDLTFLHELFIAANAGCETLRKLMFFTADATSNANRKLHGTDSFGQKFIGSFFASSTTHTFRG